jgi:anti-anti-sigma factor
VDGDVPLIVMRGEFDMSTTVDLRIALKAASADHETIIVDLTDCTFLDSTAVSSLAMAAGRKRLRIRGATGITRRILESTGVIKFMEDDG